MLGLLLKFLLVGDPEFLDSLLVLFPELRFLLYQKRIGDDRFLEFLLVRINLRKRPAHDPVPVIFGVGMRFDLGPFLVGDDILRPR